MLTHVHKVIHLVVCTFEQGLETSSAECPPKECGQSDDATGTLYRKDRGSQSDQTLVVQWPDVGFRVRSVTAESTLFWSCDRTLECKLIGCSWSESGHC